MHCFQHPATRERYAQPATRERYAQPATRERYAQAARLRLRQSLDNSCRLVVDVVLRHGADDLVERGDDEDDARRWPDAEVRMPGLGPDPRAAFGFAAAERG